MCRLVLLAIGLLGSLSPSLRAQDAKPNTLTPKEIADGWILLFDGETTFGWKAQGPQTIADGYWRLGGDQPTSVETSTAFADGLLIFEYRQVGAKRKEELTLHGNPVGLLAISDKSKWLEGCFGTKNGEVIRVLRSKSIFSKDSFYPVKTNRLTTGAIGFTVPSDSQLEVRGIKFLPATSERFLNGQDLAGWKVFPDKKSEFTVADGAIHLKNGPGDLQTEKQFGDFILQLDCISHGEHLNSGVFFRCRPNEYQNGYEAQINNHFIDKPTKKYLIEEFDPETHKLLGKKEMMSTAADYGTGAIYRRQPARKSVAKDKEWFTMTIVAHGNHFATWVNGIQVTDWYDHRPPSDNARTGYRAAAGHISLQGHDPTTNLSFKNIRIQEYPTK